MVIYSAIFVCLLIIDFISKYYINLNFDLGESINLIDDFFRITYVQNTGIAFGMFQGYEKILALLTPVAVIIILIIFIKTEHKNSFIKLGFTLVLAGAVGNIIDRFYYGYVVDFIDVDFFDIHLKSYDLKIFQFPGYKMTRWPTFNIADSSISVGVFLIIIEPFFCKIKSGNNHYTEKEAPGVS